MHSEEGELRKTNPHGLHQGYGDRGRQRVTYLTILFEWIVERVVEDLRKGERIPCATIDRKMKRVYILMRCSTDQP